MPMLLLGTLFSIVFGLITGVVAAWRRGTLAEKSSVWFGLAFFSLPTQWLAIMLILYAADPLGLPTNGISDPYLSYTNPSLWAEFTDRLSHMVLPVADARPRALRRVHADHALGHARDARRGLRADRAGQGPDAAWQIVRRHALRNSLLPIIDADLRSRSGFIVGGAILDRDRLLLPGHRPARLPERVPERDYPMLQGAFLVLTTVGRARQLDRRPAVLPPRPEDRRMSRDPGTKPARRRSTTSADSRERRGLAGRCATSPQALVGGARRSASRPDRAASLRWIAPYGEHEQRRRPCSSRPRRTTGSGWTTAASTCSAC